MQIENQEEGSEEESNAYSLFLYAIRSEITRNYYLRRLRIFFNHINLSPDRTMKERCDEFALNGLKDPSWAFHCIIRFMQFQRVRVGAYTAFILSVYRFSKFYSKLVYVYSVQ